MRVLVAPPRASAPGWRMRGPDPGSRAGAGAPGCADPARRPFGSCRRFARRAAFAIGNCPPAKLWFGRERRPGADALSGFCCLHDTPFGYRICCDGSIADPVLVKRARQPVQFCRRIPRYSRVRQGRARRRRWRVCPDLYVPCTSTLLAMSISSLDFLVWCAPTFLELFPSLLGVQNILLYRFVVLLSVKQACQFHIRLCGPAFGL